MNAQTGTIIKWNENKGYGFIRPKSGGKDIFAHISGYSKAHKKPNEGLQVHYFLSTDPKGRKCAVDIRPVRGHKNIGRERRQQGAAILLSSILICVLGILYSLKLIPAPILALYLTMSVITFLFYVKDKYAAQRGRWRTPESTLHILALFGGWPGAAIAQAYLRHKSKKISFRIAYWCTIIANCTGLYWVTTPKGQIWVNKLLQNVHLG